MVRVLIFVVSFGARALRAMCRRRADLVIENLALRQQVTALKKERPRPRLDDVIELSGSRFDNRGLGGRVACSSSTRIQYRGGIEIGSGGTGRRSRSDAIRGGLASTPRSVGSSG